MPAYVECEWILCVFLSCRSDSLNRFGHPDLSLDEDKLKEAGVDSVIIYCVNDPAVMMAWAKDQGIENWEITESDGFVSFVSDPKSDLTSACGMTMTNPGPLSVGLFQRCVGLG